MTVLLLMLSRYLIDYPVPKTVLCVSLVLHYNVKKHIPFLLLRFK